jgi:hypothetical protein
MMILLGLPLGESFSHRTISETMVHWIQLNDPTVTKIALYRPKPTWSRLDVAPFVACYAVLHVWSTYASIMNQDATYWPVMFSFSSFQYGLSNGDVSLALLKWILYQVLPLFV